MTSDDIAKALGKGTELEHEYFAKIYFALMVWTNQIRPPQGEKEPKPIAALRRFSDNALKGSCRFLERKDFHLIDELSKITKWPKPRKEVSE